jgi:hypothetical protein
MYRFSLKWPRTAKHFSSKIPDKCMAGRLRIIKNTPAVGRGIILKSLFFAKLYKCDFDDNMIITKY